MGYGHRKARRAHEPDPRDVVEDAARADGVSVAEWLDRAARDAAREEEARRNPRQARRARQEEYRDHDGHDQTHGVNRMLGEALEDFDAALKRSERRTIAELETLREEIAAQDSRRKSVQGLQSDVATAFEAKDPAAPTAQRRRSDDLIAAIEDRVSRVVSQLEANAPQIATVNAPPASATLPPKSDARLAAMEQAVKELAQKLDMTPAPSTPNPELTEAVDEMLDALRRIQSETQARTTTPDAFESLNRKLDMLPAIQKKLEKLENAPPAESAELRSLRAELAALRHGMAQQPRLADPAIAGLEAQFAGLAKRMDMIAEHLVASRQRSARDLRASRPQMTAQSAPQLQDALRQALGELQPHVQQQSAGQIKVLGAISEIERKIEAIKAGAADGRQMDLQPLLDAIKRPETDPRVLSALATLERKLDAIERAPTDLAPLLDRVRAPEPDPRVLNALQALERKVEAIERSPADISGLLEMVQRREPDPQIIQALKAIERKVEQIEQDPRELSQRLDHLQSMVTDRSSQPAMPAHLETMLSDMARRIDQMPARGEADDASIDRLQAEVRTLANRMESAATGPGAAAAGDVAAIERGLQDLFLQMERMKREMTDATERAARQVAEATAQGFVERQLNLQQQSTASIAEDETVQRALTDLHVAQQESERRTTQTLEAVHSTLHRVIDRLVDMERDMQKAAIAAAVVPASPRQSDGYQSAGLQPAMFQSSPQETPRPLEPVVHQDRVNGMRDQASPLAMRAAAPEPAMAQPAYEPPVFEESLAAVTPAQPVNTGQSAAALRAERLGVTMPAEAQPVAKTESKSAILGAIAAAKNAVGNLKRGKEKARAQEQLAPPVEDVPTNTHPAVGAAARARAAASFDMPLEPGSGRPSQGRSPAQTIEDKTDPKA
ncbi:MAG: hypothetical protein ACRC7G_09785, partial [Beijerinckiaceae bacterium]